MTRIMIPMVPPSPNELRRKYRSPFAYKRLRTAWENSLAYAVPNSGVHQLLKARAKVGCVRVAITIYHSKPFDDDNLYGSLKPILDAMRNIGYIQDDNKKWLKLKVEQLPFVGEGLDKCTIIEIDDS